MPRPWLVWPSYQQKKLGKLKRTALGYALAFDRLQDGTGLIYLHLQTTQSSIPVTLVDRLHIEHRIDLSTTFFILQKRADPVTPPLPRLALEALLQKRAAAHLDDHDPRLQSNIGRVEGELIFIDAGRFVDAPNATSTLPEKILPWLDS